MAIADWIRILVLSLVWGGSFFFVEVMLLELPVLTSVLGRLVVGAAGLLLVLKVLGYSLRELWLQWRPFAFLGLVNTAVPFSLISLGQTQITGSLASIINASTPIMTALVAHWSTTDERLSVQKALGIGLGFTGVLVLFGPAALSADATFLGMTAGLVATFCYAVGSVFSKRLKHNPPMLNAAGQVGYGVLWMLPLTLWIDTPWVLALPSLGPVLAMLGIGLLSTTFAFYLYFQVLRTAGASNVVLVTFLVPVSASVLGITVLSESLDWNDVFAYALIAGGLVIIDGRVPRALGIFRLKSHN